MTAGHYRVDIALQDSTGLTRDSAQAVLEFDVLDPTASSSWTNVAQISSAKLDSVAETVL